MSMKRNHPAPRTAGPTSLQEPSHRMALPDPMEQPTVPLWPTAARACGLGRGRAYELARRGELPFPVYRLGRSWRVPTAALRRALHLDGADTG